ncbi:hypothetical protein F5146DRAFT_998001 [Armillaria mellea]|nr:hypothetical protein F5146DRAFT_998001 [Armillaria mellea]
MTSETAEIAIIHPQTTRLIVHTAQRFLEEARRGAWDAKTTSYATIRSYVGSESEISRSPNQCARHLLTRPLCLSAHSSPTRTSSSDPRIRPWYQCTNLKEGLQMAVLEAFNRTLGSTQQLNVDQRNSTVLSSPSLRPSCYHIIKLYELLRSAPQDHAPDHCYPSENIYKPERSSISHRRGKHVESIKCSAVEVRLVTDMEQEALGFTWTFSAQIWAVHLTAASDPRSKSAGDSSAVSLQRIVLELYFNLAQSSHPDDYRCLQAVDTVWLLLSPLYNVVTYACGFLEPDEVVTSSTPDSEGRLE